MLQPLTANDHVDALLSTAGPAWLLKHSNTCPISQAAHEAVETYLARHGDQPVGVVVVQTHRPVSNWVSTKLGVTHQSPQLFLLKGGKVAWQASHWSITAEAMEGAWSAVRGP